MKRLFVVVFVLSAFILLGNSTITHSGESKKKKLIPTHSEGRAVQITAFEDEKEEAQAIAQQVRELAADGASLKGMALFYRVNAQSRALEEAFIKEKIPYQIVRGVEFYRRKEVRDLLAYLKVLVNPNDEIALLRVRIRRAVEQGAELDALSRALGRLTQMVKAQRVLTGEAASEFERAMNEVLTSLVEELGLSLE